MSNLNSLARVLASICFILLALCAFSQNKYTLSGTVSDSFNGETLIGATIRIKSTGTGVTTNEYGYYALQLPEGNHILEISYIGYQSTEEKVEMSSDKRLNFQLDASEIKLSEVEIEAERRDQNVEEVQMSTIRMPIAQIKKMPAFLGEVDIIKSIQLLPGVSSAGEGNSGFFVRGGAADQNLVLLDEANVYNASHLFGFFSVFNPDAIKDVQLYKGGIPARYGGRLASVLDIRMEEGNLKQWESFGGIGLLSSRVTVQGPIKKEKGSILISGRRTYLDVFLKAFGNEEVKNNTLYFYDFNLKSNYILNDKNRVYLSGYFGRDVFAIQNDLAKIGFGNATATARWNHIFNSRLFSNATLIYSNYDYNLGTEGDLESFNWLSRIKDWTGKYDLNYFENPSSTWRGGIQLTHHNFQPGDVSLKVDSSQFFEYKIDPSLAWEGGIYLEREHKITARLNLQYGIRYSWLWNVGEGTSYSLDERRRVTDTISYAKGEIFNRYGGLEPRFAARYTLSESSSVKASYNRMRQYAQLASNSTASSPLDIWFLAGPNVAPQIADQIAVGYFKNLANNSIETSVELYYKWMDQAIDFKNQAELLLNKELEAEIRVGDAYSYGLELFARKNEGRFTGFVSYTLSRTMKKIDVDETLPGIEIFPAKYDKTHDLAVSVGYNLNEKWSFSSNFVYATGLAATFPSGKFYYKNVLIPTYTARNGGRFP
ncbi:MAG: TonB-dependent receptor, partial [Luteibaculum sp.]